MSIFKRKEKISKKALDHSCIGTFSKNSKTSQMKMQSGGHGKENFSKLNEYGISYEIIKKFPNGVMIGNVENHRNKDKRINNGQSWFPKSWSRNQIKRSAEKLANSMNYKLPDGMTMYGSHNGVKIGIKRTNGKISTIFPYYKQSGGNRNDKK